AKKCLMMLSCLLLAAGCSSRMKGTNKLLLQVGGEALVRHTLREIQTIEFDDVVVVTGFQHELISYVLCDLSPRMVLNENHATGMHSSIRAGLLALRTRCDAFVVCLGDQPPFDRAHIAALIDAFARSDRGGIIVPTF